MSKGAKSWRVPTSSTPLQSFQNLPPLFTGSNPHHLLWQNKAGDPKCPKPWTSRRLETPEEKATQRPRPQAGSFHTPPARPPEMSGYKTQWVCFKLVVLNNWSVFIKSLVGQFCLIIALEDFFSGLCVLRDNTGVKSAIETYKDRFWCRCFKSYIKKC